MEVKSKRLQIAVIVPPNAQSLDVSGPIDAFLEANRQSGGSADYQLCLISIDKDKIVRAGGISLVADASVFDAWQSFDTLLVAGTSEYRQVFDNADLHMWLRWHSRRVRRCGSIGTGAFALGAAGLLHGKNVTTHWQHTAELAEKCPSANVFLNHIYVEDGALYTSAGVTAGLDLALKLIQEDHGRTIARKVAHRLVAFLKPSGRRKQFSRHLAMQGGSDERIATIQRWIYDHVNLDLTSEALAGRAGMGVRHFRRIFEMETGTTPGDFVEKVRVDEAKRLLQDRNMPLQHIALQCGYANAEVLSNVFRRRTGIRPRLYRESLRG
jgi:transcriptional regulator GlxA family with amidase domain